ncbi:unnamed protein product, partial [Discosporangium mesarthrocarpum]
LEDHYLPLIRPSPSERAQIGEFEQNFELFHLSLAEHKTGNMVACVDRMQESVNLLRVAEGQTGGVMAVSGAKSSSVTDVYEEMLRDCRRKAGEATLDCLRGLCQRQGRLEVGSD